MLSMSFLFYFYCLFTLTQYVVFLCYSEVYTVYFEQENIADENILAQLCRCFKLFYAVGYHTKGLHQGILGWIF